MTDNIFRKVWDLGYGSRILPVAPPDAKAAPKSQLADRKDLGKIPGYMNFKTGLWWSYDWIGAPDCDEDDLDRYLRMGAGLGIKTGNGLALIDADAPELEHAKIIRERIEARFGDAMPVRIGKNPKAGYLVRVEGDYPYKRIAFGPDGKDKKPIYRVEILTDGRYFVAFGEHPGTRKPYTWPREIVAFDKLPVVTPAGLDAMLEELRGLLPAATEIVREGTATNISQGSLRGEVDRVRRAVEGIPNNDNSHPSRENYRDMLYAIKAALPDDEATAFDIALKWCEPWVGPEGDTNDPATVRKDWDRMPGPYRRGAGWLYEEYARFNDGKTVWFEVITPEMVSEMEADERAAAQKLIAEKAHRFTFLPFDAAADMALGEKTAPLIKGLLDQGAMSVMYGDSNTGKTFVAMDMGFHIGAGLPYAGMKTTKSVVVYIAAEGGRGAKKRLMALRDKFGDKAKGVQFYLLATSVNLRDPNADLAPLIEALRMLAEQVGASIGFLVVDTMSRALAGGDENSSVDVGLLVKNFDALRAATGAHLMVVHHSGKDRARGARGWSGLRAATDTEIEIAENMVTVGKQRDLDKAWSSGFALEVRTLGLDEDGDPITSCTIRLVDAAAVRVGVATATEQDVLDAIAILRATDKDAAHGVTARLLEAYFAQNKSPMTAENLRYYIRALETKRLLIKAGRGRWVNNTDHPPLSSRDKLSDDDFSEVEESGGNLEAGVFD